MLKPERLIIYDRLCGLCNTHVHDDGPTAYVINWLWPTAKEPTASEPFHSIWSPNIINSIYYYLHLFVIRFRLPFTTSSKKSEVFELI